MTDDRLRAESLRERAEALGPWFHNIEIAPGLFTAPGHFLGDYPMVKWRTFADAVPRRRPAAIEEIAQLHLVGQQLGLPRQGFGGLPQGLARQGEVQFVVQARHARNAMFHGVCSPFV